MNISKILMDIFLPAISKISPAIIHHFNYFFIKNSE